MTAPSRTQVSVEEGCNAAAGVHVGRLIVADGLAVCCLRLVPALPRAAFICWPKTNDQRPTTASVFSDCCLSALLRLCVGCFGCLWATYISGRPASQKVKAGRPAVMLSRERPCFGRSESKHPYCTHPTGSHQGRLVLLATDHWPLITSVTGNR
jgi:hypothetical protein